MIQIKPCELTPIYSKQLGTDKTFYQSAAMAAAERREVPAQPIYKNYNERVDIITGAVLDKNQKNCGYERFTENSQMARSANTTVLPSDLAVRDPITGREFIQK